MTPAEPTSESAFYSLEHERPLADVVSVIEEFKRGQQGTTGYAIELAKLEKKLDKLKQKVYRKLTPWERILICRHARRPHTIDYIKHITDKFIELSGDRLYGDDSSVIGGFASIDDVKFMLIGQEKGSDTESRMERNFGMSNPEGFRKALRLMKLAEKFRLPIVTFVDTPGANPGLEAEERGQGWAIANNLLEMAQIRVPITVLIIGEGCSGGALGIAVGDVVAMLEHAYYSVISPEGCASILWKDSLRRQEAASALKLNAENLLESGLIDHIIPEPLGGAHHNPDLMCTRVKHFILEKYYELQTTPTDSLLEQRYAKFRSMGRFCE
jgi:acetyl-CoA carboxylase carboxyl transferase subunit alpha